MRTISVLPQEAGVRLDNFLKKYMSGAPSGFIYRMLRKKNILLNEVRAKGDERLCEGDSIRLFLSDETIEKFRRPIASPQGTQAAGRAGFSLAPCVIYEDDDIILINKPAGMLSQKAAPSDISLNEHIVSYLMENGSVDKEELRAFMPSVCNRLDRNTSGLITAGKTLAGSRMLSELFKKKLFEKYYLALVKGVVTKTRDVHAILKKDCGKNIVKIIRQDVDAAKEDPPSYRMYGASNIRTQIRPLGTGSGVTLLLVRIFSGKTHQIRAQLCAIGHPVIGDPKYGDADINMFYRKKHGIRRQLLHSYKLAFPGMPAVSGMSFPPPVRLCGREFMAGPAEDFKGCLSGIRMCDYGDLEFKGP